MRRKYQQGYVYQKGRRKSDRWLPTEPAYVQFWKDVPGQETLRRLDLALGICQTRTIAERTAAEKLEKLGINSTRHFVEATSNITFRQQGELWLKSLANRKRNPLEQTTIDNRRYALARQVDLCIYGGLPFGRYQQPDDARPGRADVSKARCVIHP